MKNVPGLHFTLDTGNFAFSDEDALAACQTLRDRIVHVHCKDRAADASALPGKYSRGLLPCAVGDGYISMGTILTYLKEIAYTGGLTIEHYNTPDYEEAMRRSADYLHRAVNRD